MDDLNDHNYQLCYTDIYALRLIAQLSYIHEQSIDVY